MSNQRLILKGKQQELKDQRRKLGFKAEALMESITNDLALYKVTKLTDIDTESIMYAAEELHKIHTHAVELDNNIAEIEAELNG
ncbi:MAG: hypothetical protein AB7E96_12135 [Deferribacterales bacterium]